MTVVCGLLQVVGKGKVVDHASLMKAITTIAIPTSREHWHVNNLTPTCHCQAANGRSTTALRCRCQFPFNRTAPPLRPPRLVPVPIS
jgi:hypothetical protein